jgi:hypothetical protein
MTSDVSDEDVLHHLRSTLNSLPGTEVVAWETEVAHSTGRVDAQGELSVSGRPVKLLVEIKKNAFPRDVRQALSQLKDYKAHIEAANPKQPVVALLVSGSISEGARELLRREGIGYFDNGGSLFLPARGAYAFIDKPVPRALSRSIRSLFTGRRSKVLHAMLRRPREWLSVKDLAAAAAVSPATASETLTELEKFDWAISRGNGPTKVRTLHQPGELLNAWVRHVEGARPPAVRRYFVPTYDANQVAHRFAAACEANDVSYALTHEIAAQRYAPYVTHVSQVRCRLLRGPAAEAAIGELNARAVNDGANFTVIETKSPGDLDFRERIDDIWFADPIQVYLDLTAGEGRTKELAEHLRSEKIGF